MAAALADVPSPAPGAELAAAEASSSEGRGDRAELFTPAEDSLMEGEASFLGVALAEKDEALQQAAAVANLRAALMSKNSLLSLKAEALGDDGTLLLEYLPKGTHSLSCKCGHGRMGRAWGTGVFSLKLGCLAALEGLCADLLSHHTAWAGGLSKGHVGPMTT